MLFYFFRSQLTNSRLRTNMFNKHNVSEKNSKILKSSYSSSKGGTLIVTNNIIDKSPVFNKDTIDIFPPSELVK